MIRRTSHLDPLDGVECLLNGIRHQDMRLVAHIDGQANAAPLGLHAPPDQILELFRPDHVVRVWRAHKPAGLEIPLRIHVYQENESGPAHIAARTPTEVFAPYGSNELKSIGAELTPIFERIVAAMPEEATS